MGKLLNIFLLAETVVCILLCVIGGASSNLLYAILAFPFKQTGDVLRNLSLSGVLGNIVAVALYCIICLIPAIVLLVKLIRRRFKVEDILLGVLSGTLFAVMYYMVNMGEFIKRMVLPLERNILAAILGAIVYSVLFGYIVLKLTRRFRLARTERLKGYLNVLLFVVNVIIIYATFGSGLNSLMTELDNLEATNNGLGQELCVTKVFLWAKYFINMVINLMTVGIIASVQNLIGELDVKSLSDRVVTKAGRISVFCVVAIVTHIILNIVFNLSQLFAVQELYVINGLVNIPVMLVVFMMIFMVVAQFITDARRIKEENDMFI